MEVWTCDCFPIDSGLVKKAEKTGKTDASGNELYSLKEYKDSHGDKDVYKIALYDSGITPQTMAYTSAGEVTHKNYPKSGVRVDIDIEKTTGKSFQVFFKENFLINAPCSYGLLYNAINGKAILAYRLIDGEPFIIESTRVYT